MGYTFLTTASFREMARTRAQQWFEGRFRGRLQIGELEWRPFSNSAVIRDIEIRDPESSDDQPAIRLKQAILNFSLLRLLSPAVDLQEVVLDGLEVRVRRELDDRINLARVFERQSAPPSPSSEAAGLGPFIDLAIDQIRVSQSQILYFDRSVSLSSLEGSLSFKLALVPAQNSYRGDLELRELELTVSGVRLPPTDLTTQFRLEQTRVLLDSATLASDWLGGRFSGIIDGYQSLDHRVDLNLDLDSATLSRVYSLGRPLAGRLHLTGTALGRRGDYGLIGKISGNTIRIGDYQIDQPEADIRLDGSGAEISQMSGSFQSVPFQAAGKLWWGGNQVSSFQGSSRSLLGHSLLVPVRPYADLLPSSQLRGEVRFPGINFSQWSASGDLNLPATLAKRGEPPLSPRLAARATWEADASGLQVRDCRIELAATLIRCQGTLQSTQDFQFRFSLESLGTGETVDWAQAWLPVTGPRLVGPITGEGTLEGRAGEPLQWISQTSLSQLWYQEWMLGGAKLDVSNGEDGSWNVSLKLDDQGAVEGRVSAVLDRQAVPVRSARGRLEGQIGSLLDQQLGLQDSRSEAALDFLVERDSNGRLSGGLSLQGEDWRVAGQPIPGVQAEAKFSGPQLELEALHLTLPGEGLVQIHGNIDLEQSIHRLELLGRDLDLSQLTLFDTPLPVTGIVRVSGSSSGTQWPPRFSLDVSSDSIEALDRRFGPVSIQLDHPEGDPQAQLKGTLHFQEQPVSFEGNLGLAAPFRFLMAGSLTNLPLSSVLELTFPEARPNLPPLSGLLNGSAQLSGTLREPRLDTARLNLDQVVLATSDLELRNRGPLSIELAENRINLGEVTFEGSGSTLTLRGNVSLDDDPALSLRARGTATLDLLNPFLETAKIVGRADVRLALGGTWRPRVVGEVDISEATIQHPALPERLTRVSSQLRFTADQIAVEDFQADHELWSS